jgi:hypothetical protein
MRTLNRVFYSAFYNQKVEFGEVFNFHRALMLANQGRIFPKLTIFITGCWRRKYHEFPAQAFPKLKTFSHRGSFIGVFQKLPDILVKGLLRVDGNKDDLEKCKTFPNVTHLKVKEHFQNPMYLRKFPMLEKLELRFANGRSFFATITRAAFPNLRDIKVHTFFSVIPYRDELIDEVARMAEEGIKVIFSSIFDPIHFGS